MYACDPGGIDARRFGASTLPLAKAHDPMLCNRLIKNGRSSTSRGAAAAWRCRECGRQDL
jgi:hypothetical protein